MIPIPIASKIIDGINQLNQGLFEAAKWVEEQAYAGIEDHYALAGDRPPAPAESAAVEESAQDTIAQETAAQVQEEPEVSVPAVSLVEVRTALSALSQAGKTAQVRELIQAAGAVKLSDVDPTKFGCLLEQAKGLTDA